MIDVFETDVVVARIIDMALFADIPDNKRDAVSTDEGYMFYLIVALC